MEAKTARTTNIRLLVAEAGGPTRFVQLYGNTRWTQAQVSQWVSEATPKGIGHALARSIEQAVGKPHGWLDSISPTIAPPDLRAELDGVTACLRAFAAAMALHRPAEGADVAAALRSIPERYPLATELAEALSAVPAVSRSR